MPVKKRPEEYQQLDDEALALLRRRLAHHNNNRSALGRELDMARSSISQALDRRYPGGTRVLRRKIFQQLQQVNQGGDYGAENI